MSGAPDYVSRSAVAAAARQVASDADNGTAWNYDTIQTTALYAVRDAFTEFARLIEAGPQELDVSGERAWQL